MSLKSPRIVITGVGLTAPNGNTLTEFRHNLLAGVGGIEKKEIRYMGELLAGVCHYDALKYQTKNLKFHMKIFYQKWECLFQMENYI
jgi:3-oxoacyl-[acyl-carrier-protein] synthase II